MPGLRPPSTSKQQSRNPAAEEQEARRLRDRVRILEHVDTGAWFVRGIRTSPVAEKEVASQSRSSQRSRERKIGKLVIGERSKGAFERERLLESHAGPGHVWKRQWRCRERQLSQVEDLQYEAPMNSARPEPANCSPIVRKLKSTMSPGSQATQTGARTPGM